MGSPVITPQMLQQLQAQQAPDPSVQQLNSAAGSPVNAPPMSTNAPQISVPQAQPLKQEGGPIKSFLSNFLYGAGQSLLKDVGMPTDYEKQQTAIQNQRQQQELQNQTANSQQNIASSQQNQQFEAAQNKPIALPGPVAKDLGIASVPLKNYGAAISSWSQLRQNNGAIPVSDEDAALLGLEPGSTISAKQVGVLHNLRSQQTQYVGTKDIGGRTVQFDKRNGSIIKDMGPSNALVVGASNANQRAAAMARYGLVESVDESGAPIAISRLQALQQGTPTFTSTQAKEFSSDAVGLAQYDSILRNQIQPNIKVLNDPGQRAIIAHTLSEGEKNPGAAQSLLTAAAQQGLTPQGAALVAGILQGREFGSVARKYGGNMNGTDGLQNRIMANQASPINTEEVNKNLINNDIAFTGKALAARGNLLKRSVKTGAPATPTSTPAASGTTDSFFHPIK